jgi:hypothetical protein
MRSVNCDVGWDEPIWDEGLCENTTLTKGGYQTSAARQELALVRAVGVN